MIEVDVQARNRKPAIQGIENRSRRLPALEQAEPPAPNLPGTVAPALGAGFVAALGKARKGATLSR